MPSLPTRLLATVVFAALAGPALAQAPPGTDILILDLKPRQADAQGTRLTNFTNRPGYDNQPFFLPDGSGLLYTSIRDDQADIFRLDLSDGTQQQLTRTPESEYSPTPLPSGEGFSVVRVEADSTQRLWRFAMDGQSPALLLPDLQPVGYHAWADAHTVALFVLGDPPTLQLADTRTGTVDTVATNIGRSLHRRPGTRTISFVQKADRAWTIQSFDPATKSITPITETLPNREDYAWHPDGRLFMADGPVLYDWTPERGTWAVLVGFSSIGVTTITRIAISPDGSHAALVVDRPE